MQTYLAVFAALTAAINAGNSTAAAAVAVTLVRIARTFAGNGETVRECDLRAACERYVTRVAVRTAERRNVANVAGAL